MKTIKDYCNLYLIFEVLFLADVFQKFRSYSLENYGLCPSHYLAAPALSWNAMTKVEFELISDLDMFIFLKKGMRVSVFLYF